MQIFIVFWDYLIQTAPYLLLGLGAAGLIHAFVGTSFVQRHLGGRGPWAVFKASLVGIPLPLCSCSVIPTAVELRKAGAGNGPTSSFLIATPESGVDSMAMTYAMMDIPMTLIRPVAAFVTATLAGLCQNAWNFHQLATPAASGGCCPQTAARKNLGPVPRPNRLWVAMRYGYFDLVEDLALWLSIGLVVGGALDMWLPPHFFEGANGLAGKLLVLGVGIPVYICASATTPIAAALMLKGMSPGTALILLLVGPATNISNLAVLQYYLGKRGILINILVIATVSFALSYLVDYGYARWGTSPLAVAAPEEHAAGSGLGAQLAAAVLSVLLLRGMAQNWKKRRQNAAL